MIVKFWHRITGKEAKDLYEKLDAANRDFMKWKEEAHRVRRMLDEESKKTNGVSAALNTANAKNKQLRSIMREHGIGHLYPGSNEEKKCLAAPTKKEGERVAMLTEEMLDKSIAHIKSAKMKKKPAAKGKKK